MTEPKTTLRNRNKCMPCSIMLVGILVFCLIAFTWALQVFDKVFKGAGLEYCCAISGVRFNYISVFVFLSAAAIALLAAAIVQLRGWLIRRDFERKYRVKISSTPDRLPSASGPNTPPSFHGVGYGDGD